MQTRDQRRFSLRLRSTLRDAVDFLYPPTCALCLEPMVDFETTPRALCGRCYTSVAPILTDRCFRCSGPVGPHLDTSRGCIHCRDDRFAFERVASLGAYDGQLRSAVLLVKQQGGDVLAAALADLLVDRELDLLDRGRIDLIVPVPHHWTDRLLRRHLPPVTLAARLARRLMVPWNPHILAKLRRTRAQSALEPTDRRNNLRGAFRLIGKPQLAGLRVLLVDDVLTTGTTAHRAAGLLNKAGATVNVVVLARGLGVGAQSVPVS